jgi:hypothetical protein
MVRLLTAERKKENTKILCRRRSTLPEMHKGEPPYQTKERGMRFFIY